MSFIVKPGACLACGAPRIPCTPLPEICRTEQTVPSVQVAVCSRIAALGRPPEGGARGPTDYRVDRHESIRRLLSLLSLYTSCRQGYEKGGSSASRTNRGFAATSENPLHANFLERRKAEVHAGVRVRIGRLR